MEGALGDFYNFSIKRKHFEAYEVYLKSNGTVHAARKTFIAEKKALLSMMSKLLSQRKKHCFL